MAHLEINFIPTKTGGLMLILIPNGAHVHSDCVYLVWGKIILTAKGKLVNSVHVKIVYSE